MINIIIIHLKLPPLTHIAPFVQFVDTNVAGVEKTVVSLRVNRSRTITRKLKCTVRTESTTAIAGVYVCVCVCCETAYHGSGVYHVSGVYRGSGVCMTWFWDVHVHSYNICTL